VVSVGSFAIGSPTIGSLAIGGFADTHHDMCSSIADTSLP
jgi:hypothetical protein